PVRWPFDHSMPRKTNPIDRLNRGINQRERYQRRADLLAASVGIEYLLHRLAEKPSQGDRERKRRRVAVLLDRVDRLAGHLHLQSELPLRQSALRAQMPDDVLHRPDERAPRSAPAVPAGPRSSGLNLGDSPS